MTYDSNGSTAVYTYSATGKKLGVRHVTANSNVYEAYCGNFIYRNGNLTRVLVDGWYITFSGTTPHYHFYLRDHLGNKRAVVNASKTVEEVSHYYPYGGLFGENAGSSVQPYKYNGKELDRMNGLDLYDYGVRHMDSAHGCIMRWSNIGGGILFNKSCMMVIYSFMRVTLIKMVYLLVLQKAGVHLIKGK